MNENVFDLLMTVIAISLVAAIPAGVALTLVYDNPWCLIISVIAAIVLYAG